MKKNTILIIAGVVVLIVIGLFIYLIRAGKIRPFAAGEPTLRLYPSANIVNVGNTFGVNIMADPAGAQAAGVQVYSLHFDKNYLEAQGFSHGDSIFSTWMDENIDNNNGTISFSVLLAGSQSFSSEKKVGTINFLAKAAVTSTAVTLDCCAVGQSAIGEFDTGRNLLTDPQFAQGGSYTISEAQGQTPGGQTPPGGDGNGTRSPTPTCGGPKQPTCPPTSEPTPPETESTPTPEEIVIPTTPTETPQISLGQSPATAVSPSEETSYGPSPETSQTPSPIASEEPKIMGMKKSLFSALMIILGLLVIGLTSFLILRRRDKLASPDQNDFDEI